MAGLIDAAWPWISLIGTMCWGYNAGSSAERYRDRGGLGWLVLAILCVGAGVFMGLGFAVGFARSAG
jgi:hypothetical protein